MPPTFPTSSVSCDDPDGTDRTKSTFGKAPSIATGTNADEAQPQVLELETSNGQEVHVTACCPDCIVVGDQDLADKIWNKIKDAPADSRRLSIVTARNPAKGPSVDLGPAVDAATGTDTKSGTDLVLDGWQALSDQEQHRIIAGAAGAGSLIIGGLLVKWAFFGEKGRVRRATAWAFCLKCVGSDRIR